MNLPTTDAELNALLISQRDALTIVHVANLKELADANAEEKAIADDAIAALKTAHAEAVSQRDAALALIAQSKTLYLQGDHEGIQALIVESEKSEREKAREAAQAKLDAAQAELDAIPD